MLFRSPNVFSRHFFSSHRNGFYRLVTPKKQTYSVDGPHSLRSLENLLYSGAREIDFSKLVSSGDISERCPIKRIYINQLAANDPVEDRWNIGLTQVDGVVSSCLFTVLDGHSGTACVQALAWSILDYMAASVLSSEKLKVSIEQWHAHNLDQPYHLSRRLDAYSPKENKLLEHPASPPSNSLVIYLRMCLRKYIEELVQRTNRSTDPAECFMDALTRLDDDLCSIHLKNELFETTNNNKVNNRTNGASLFSSGTALSRDLIRVALSGSVGIAGRFYWAENVGQSDDTKTGELHLANVGDCAAVLIRSDTGVLRTIECTTPHTGRLNPQELLRIQNEHPENPISELFRDGGRLLGELAPSRAFGDVRYKWPIDRLLNLSRLLEMNSINTASEWLPLPRPYTSPPYLTAKPEITRIELTSADRYLIVATDGLWDMLSAKQAGNLLTEVTHRKRVCPATQLLWSSLTNIPEQMIRAILTGPNYSGSFIDELFQSSNGSNVLNTREQRKAISRALKLLSLPSGLARYHRDDITILVFELFDRDYEAS